ncbi:MAG: hypothetical protein KF847_20400 [Pirellulales bacterium]|nr:hypothetical protein [Pirellulales bacterium]
MASSPDRHDRTPARHRSLRWVVVAAVALLAIGDGLLSARRQARLLHQARSLRLGMSKAEARQRLGVPDTDFLILQSGVRMLGYGRQATLRNLLAKAVYRATGRPLVAPAGQPVVLHFDAHDRLATIRRGDEVVHE